MPTRGRGIFTNARDLTACLERVVRTPMAGTAGHRERRWPCRVCAGDPGYSRIRALCREHCTYLKAYFFGEMTVLFEDRRHSMAWLNDSRKYSAPQLGQFGVGRSDDWDHALTSHS